MNNTINRIKKRADTLTDYIVNKVERLEAENHELEERSRNIYLMFKKYDMAFDKVVKKANEISKDENGDIRIMFKDKNGNKWSTYIVANSILYPLGEIILKKWEDKVEFERLLRKGIKTDFTPITPLTKGE